MNDSTTPAGTPASGRPFAGIRRGLAAFDGRLLCDECGSDLDSDGRCAACVQRRRQRAGLESVIDTYTGDRPWATVERSDVEDGTTGPVDEAGEPEGWPW